MQCEHVQLSIYVRQLELHCDRSLLTSCPTHVKNIYLNTLNQILNLDT